AQRDARGEAAEGRGHPADDHHDESIHPRHDTDHVTGGIERRVKPPRYGCYQPSQPKRVRTYPIQIDSDQLRSDWINCRHAQRAAKLGSAHMQFNGCEDGDGGPINQEGLRQKVKFTTKLDNIGSYQYRQPEFLLTEQQRRATMTHEAERA